MFKYAFVIGICVEWVFGPEIISAPGALYALMRALVAMLVAWMVLEALRVPVRAVKTLDDKSRAEREAMAQTAAAAAERRRERLRREAEAAASASDADAA